MDFPEPIPVTDLAARFQAELIGDDSLVAKGINEVHQVRPGDVTFVDVAKYVEKALRSPASIILVNFRVPAPPGKALLLCNRPFAAYNDLILAFRPHIPQRDAISREAEIHPSTIIEPNVVIGPHVRIGKDCHIHANVVIEEHTYIGDRVLIQSGAIIGTEAFYYKREPEGFLKWRSGGRVILEDDVEIGAGCTINKGVSGDTRIGEGTKLDGQVHIGHDVVIGKRCLIAAQVGIGGNSTLGDSCILYGQVGIAQNLVIGDRVIIQAKSGVSKNLESEKTYFGYPAGEARGIYRELAALRNLPDLLKKLRR